MENCSSDICFHANKLTTATDNIAISAYDTKWLTSSDNCSGFDDSKVTKVDFVSSILLSLQKLCDSFFDFSRLAVGLQWICPIPAASVHSKLLISPSRKILLMLKL
jgi:hypothetical protein